MLPSMRRRIPFQNLKTENWINLAMAGILAFYLFYSAWEMFLGTTCGQIGVDFCDYWSAAKVANISGYASMYDLDLLYAVEQTVLPPTLDPSHFPVVPYLYLPVFILPFQPLSLIAPWMALWIWNSVSILALYAYLRFFTRGMGVEPASARLVLMLMASLPVFLNIFAGQVGVWLAICVGEFLRASKGNRPLRAGFWLGGLLIKPQVLVLLVPILALQRANKILAALMACIFLLGLASVSLIGSTGMLQMLQLWIAYAGSQAHIWIEGMMNWRMLGFHLSALTAPWMGYGIALTGMALTLFMTVRAWRRPVDMQSPQMPVAVLGILAATTVFTWHSQINTAMILIPPMVYLLQARALPRKAPVFWVFLPALAFIPVVFAPGLLATLKVASPNDGRFLYFFIGAPQFAVDIYLFWWALRASRQGS